MKVIIEKSYILIFFLIAFVFKDSVYGLIESKDYKIDNCIYLKNMEENYHELLKFSEIDVKYEMNYLNSYILYKDVYNYLNEITILKGSKDNILVDYPVIYNNTLVGVISKVNKNSSKVTLLTNNESRISVKINNEIGILEYDNVLKITGISNYGNISIGDEIYTSGLGKIPANIFIGRVKDIILDNKGLEKIVFVEYDIDIKDLTFVTILEEKLS